MKKVLIFIAFMTFCIASFGIADEHPQEMGNKDCISCHMDPEEVEDTKVVAEYEQSVHNFAGVTCGNCHGDVADFQSAPGKAVCQSCHSEEVANVRIELPCQSCHLVHTFNVHMK